MKLDGLKIKCIGFSVTTFGKPNYAQAMQTYFDDRGVNVEVTHASVGGLSVDSLPYLLESIIKKDQVDLVILEIATSWFSLVRKNEGEADKYMELIVKYIEGVNASILFLNMYRKDIEDEDIIVRSIRDVAKDKYPILDFKKHYREVLNQTGDDGTTDGVHPRPEIINFIAAEICNEVFKSIPNFKTYYAKLENSSIYHLQTYDLLGQMNYKFDNRSGLVLDCRKIVQGEKVLIKNSQKMRISGIFYLLGPDTNQLTMHLDGKYLNIPMRDEASYYRRLGYRYLGVHECSEIILEHPSENLDVKLTREPWEKVESLCNYIVGFSGYI